MKFVYNSLQNIFPYIAPGMNISYKTGLFYVSS